MRHSVVVPDNEYPRLVRYLETFYGCKTIQTDYTASQPDPDLYMAICRKTRIDLI